MTKLYVMRHGETEWNRLTKLQGHEDIALNDTGRRQAKDVSKYFSNIRIDKVYSSPLKRAYETAQIISDLNSFGAINEAFDLIERDYGEASGYTAIERKEIFSDGKYPGIEDTQHLRKRMISILKHIAEENVDKNILIVSHGSAINSVLAVLSNDEVGSGKTNLHTCCVNLLNYEYGELKVEYYNKKVYE